MGAAILYGTGSGGGSGSSESYRDIMVASPEGVTITVSKGDKSYSKTADSSGNTLFSGLVPGDWTISITDGSKTVSRVISIEPEYETAIKFFAAPITITYPEGSSCTVTYGSTTTDAPDTSGTWNYIARSTGTYTFEITNGSDTATRSVDITYDGQEANLVLAYFSATIHITYPAGSTCTATDGTTMLEATDTTGTWNCIVPNAGDWTISCTDGTKTKEASVTITENGQSASVELVYIVYIVKDGVLTDIGLSNSLTSRLATVTQNDGYVYVNNSYTEYVSSVATGEKIDLTSFTSVVANIQIITKGTSATQTKFNGIGLTLTQGVSYSTLADAATGIEYESISSKTGTMTLSIDATNITGEWYVGFAIGTSGKFYIYDLYVE